MALLACHSSDPKGSGNDLNVIGAIEVFWLLKGPLLRSEIMKFFVPDDLF